MTLVVNNFTLSSSSTRGKYLVGVCWSKISSKYQAYCGNPITSKREHLGLYETELEAHLAWKKRKYELACILARSDYVTDKRVGKVLRETYKNYTRLEDHTCYKKNIEIEEYKG